MIPSFISKTQLNYSENCCANVLAAGNKILEFDDEQKKAGFSGLSKETRLGLDFTCKSIVGLGDYLKSEFDIDLLPWYVNQDSLEMFFSEVRAGTGGTGQAVSVRKFHSAIPALINKRVLTEECKKVKGGNVL